MQSYISRQNSLQYSAIAFEHAASVIMLSFKNSLTCRYDKFTILLLRPRVFITSGRSYYIMPYKTQHSSEPTPLPVGKSASVLTYELESLLPEMYGSGHRQFRNEYSSVLF